MNEGGDLTEGKGAEPVVVGVRLISMEASSVPDYLRALIKKMEASTGLTSGGDR